MSPPSRPDVQHLLDEREWLTRLARRLLGDGPDADDLTQEALTRALQATPPRAKTRGWLATVTRNLFLEQRRAEARRRAREEHVARPEAGPEGDALERMFLRRELIDEVMRLSEPERTAVVLRYFEGLTYEEVAARQDASVAAVRTRVSRAIARLRERLDGRAGGREAWACILAPLARMGPVASPQLGASAPSTLATGVLVMSAQKLVLGGCVLAVMALLVLTYLDPAQPTAGTRGPAAADELQEPVAELEAPTPVDLGREPSVPPAVAEATKAKAHAAFPLRDEATVGTLELHFRWSDGTPAAGVNARIMPWGAQDAFLLQRTVQTDSSGIGMVDQLAPGTVGVYPDRCIGGRAEIVAGQTVLHEVRIPAGVTFHGRVLDPAGRAVGGATICLSAGGSHKRGCAVTTADPGGWYEVRGVIGQRYLSARAPGHSPSQQVYATGADGSEIELDLVLRGESGSLSGVVLAPDGLPFAGARIRIEGHAPEGWQPSQVGRHSRGEPLPFALVTDEAGRFQVDQVGAGPLVVQVRAEGWAPWKDTVVVPAGSSERLDIVLAEGAVLEGTVTHADGTPAEDAYVSHGRYGGFGSTRARADSKGAYRITGLPAGSLELTASMDQRGEASTTMVLALGTTGRWDATLNEGLTVRGIVVDELDQPLARWLVGTTNGRGNSSYLAWTGADGRFVLRDIEAGATALVVGPADVVQTGPCLVLPEALHTQGDLRLVIPDAVRPSASARLRVLVDGEPAPRATQVIIRTRELYPDAEGLVAITRLIPGQHRLTVMLSDRARRYLDFEVSEREELDLGQLDLTVGGRVLLELAGEGAQGALRASVLDASGSSPSSFDVEEGTGLSHLLPAGPVRLRIVGAGVAALLIEGTVTDGETVTLRAALRPGTSRWIVARTTDGTRFPRATVSVFHSAGELVLKQSFFPAIGDFAPEARIQLLGLEPGAYRVVLTCSDSRSGEGVLTVATLEEDGEVAARIAVE